MKIGIVTYQYSFNVGAVLQAYATQKALRELGHEVEFIHVYDEKRPFKKKVVFYPKDKKTSAFFKKYYPKVTKYYQSIEDLKQSTFDYDCIMVGSDQVWNPYFSKEKCLAFFLDFGPDNIKRFSYASSFGVSEWNKNYMHLIPNIKNAFKRFNSISVREKTGQKILSDVFGIENSTLVVDPTMLHKSYEEITGNIKESNEIVCYLLGRLPHQLEISKYFGKKLNSKPRLISNLLPIKGFKYTYPPSIEGWIKKIGGAKMVITDSFHGTVFSLIYHRDFIVLPQNNGRSSRMIDLLNMCGLSDRIFTSLEEFEERKDLLKPIDYKKVDEILDKARKESWDFLKNNLNQ